MQFIQEQDSCAVQRTATAEVWRTQGWVSMKRLGPVEQPWAGSVNWCGGRGDVWKAVGNRSLTLHSDCRARDKESGRACGWALNWEDLERKKRIRTSQERKRGWGFLTLWSRSHISSYKDMVLGNRVGNKSGGRIRKEGQKVRYTGMSQCSQVLLLVSPTGVSAQSLYVILGLSWLLHPTGINSFNTQVFLLGRYYSRQVISPHFSPSQAILQHSITLWC